LAATDGFGLDGNEPDTGDVRLSYFDTMSLIEPFRTCRGRSAGTGNAVDADEWDAFDVALVEETMPADSGGLWRVVELVDIAERDEAEGGMPYIDTGRPRPLLSDRDTG